MYLCRYVNSAVINKINNSTLHIIEIGHTHRQFLLFFLHPMKANKNPKIRPVFQRTNSQKRSLTKSPTESQLSPEQSNNLKARKMAENADKNDIQELKHLMNDQFSKLNNNLLSLTKEISILKNDMQQMEERVNLIEKTREISNESITRVSEELNALNQLNLETQLSILNIPQNIGAKQALNSISSWSSMPEGHTVPRRGAIQAHARHRFKFTPH